MITIVTVVAAFLFISLVLSSPGKATDQIKVYLDGKQLTFQVPPEIIENRTLVPLRDIFEAMGAVVTWDENQKTITATRGETNIFLTIGEKTALKNNASIHLDVAPQIVEGKTLVPLRFIGESFGADVKWREENKSIYINMHVSELPILGTQEKLMELLKEAQANTAGYYRFGIGLRGMDLAEESVMKAAAPAAADAAAGDGGSYSTTNVQVQGVDEADMVKTDGEYIYQVNNQRIIIGKAYPAKEMALVKTIDLSSQPFAPRELYLDDKFLVVIGATEHYYPMPFIRGDSVKIAPDIMPPYSYRNTVKAMIYDIADKSNIKLVREVELDGYYVSSRKIGSALYLVANKYINYYRLDEGKDLDKPVYRDTAGKEDFVEIDFEKIRYFPGSIEANYLLVAGLDLEKPNKQVEVSSFLGSGQNIYASLHNLYVAVTQYDFSDKARAASHSTQVYKFSLDEGRVDYQSKGKVPGLLLNQFSMDEHKGYFRVATTTGDVWRSDEHTSKNNVYILDEGLGMVGKIEDIAPGETIYSVRFMGDRGYMVTFKTVDPLFVIDLQNPEKPSILGALKIPGYSDYLHPYDENHLIGFGKDAVEVDGMAYYLGMKMAIFDVSDVNNPKEKFVEMIGDRGTESEILRNHKALLFSREKNLLALPITVMEVKGTQNYGYKGIPPYGEFAFQGAYVYHIDLKTGFNLKGRITHLTGDDYQKAGRYWYDSNKNVERILYIGDTLYTLSNKLWKAHGIDKLDERNSLEIPERPPVRDIIYPIEVPEPVEPPAEAPADLPKEALREKDIINSKLLTPEELRSWIEENKSKAGTYKKEVEGANLYLITAGEKPTGGYQVVIDEIGKSAGEKWIVQLKLLEPNPDDMVIQVITYPYIVLGFTDTSADVEIQWVR